MSELTRAATVTAGKLLGGGADFIGKVEGLLVDQKFLELEAHLPLPKKKVEQ